MSTTTEKPDVIVTPDDDEVLVVRTKFRHRILAKLRAAWSRTKSLGRSTRHATAVAARKTGHGIKVGAQATWLGVCWAGDILLWLGTGALNLAGTGLYLLGRMVVLGATFIVMAVFTAVIAVLTGIAYVITYAFYGVMKIVHFVALVICSPWIALHSTKALKEDWEIFFTGLKPANFHVLHPTALAVATLRERERRGADRAAADGQSNGRSAARTAPKGRPTPVRQPRGARRMGPVVATV